MNEIEQARARWGRVDGALRDALGQATRDVELTILEVVEKMKTEQEAGNPNAAPDPDLIDQLVTAATRRRILADNVIPAFERLRSGATHYNPSPAGVFLATRTR